MKPSECGARIPTAVVDVCCLKGTTTPWMQHHPCEPPCPREKAISIEWPAPESLVDRLRSEINRLADERDALQATVARLRTELADRVAGDCDHDGWSTCDHCDHMEDEAGNMQCMQCPVCCGCLA